MIFLFLFLNLLPLLPLFIVGNATYVLNRYDVNMTSPRPESYAEDYRMAATVSDPDRVSERG